MSVSVIQSPSSSNVISFFPSSTSSLSPPPTPKGKKRARAVLIRGSNSNTHVHVVPMFLPSSASLISGRTMAATAVDKETMERMQLASLTSRPTPNIRLEQRPRSTTTTRVSTKRPGRGRQRWTPPLPPPLPLLPPLRRRHPLRHPHPRLLRARWS